MFLPTLLKVVCSSDDYIEFAGCRRGGSQLGMSGDRLRSLLTESVDLEVAVGEAPPVLAAGLEEAEVVEHEIIIAQWR